MGNYLGSKYYCGFCSYNPDCQFCELNKTLGSFDETIASSVNDFDWIEYLYICYNNGVSDQIHHRGPESWTSDPSHMLQKTITNDWHNNKGIYESINRQKLWHTLFNNYHASIQKQYEKDREENPEFYAKSLDYAKNLFKNHPVTGNHSSAANVDDENGSHHWTATHAADYSTSSSSDFNNTFTSAFNTIRMSNGNNHAYEHGPAATAESALATTNNRARGRRNRRRKGGRNANNGRNVAE